MNKKFVVMNDDVIMVIPSSGQNHNFDTINSGIETWHIIVACLVVIPFAISILCAIWIWHLSVALAGIAIVEGLVPFAYLFKWRINDNKVAGNSC